MPSRGSAGWRGLAGAGLLAVLAPMLTLYAGSGANASAAMARVSAGKRAACRFGTVLGLRLARNHPELYSGYVGTDQDILAGGRERSAHAALVERLRAAGRTKGLAAALAMGADRSTWTKAQVGEFNKLVLTSDPMSYDTMKTVVMRSLWFSPLHTLRGLRSHLKAMEFSEQLQLEAVEFDEWADGAEFRIPFFVFQGASDVLTPPDAAGRFFDDVTAPVKSFELIADASHFASFRHPDRFLDLMLAKVRPAL
ncbi:alpha/beta hydrolase [Kitasatospora griseola]|uniref:alpha/beta hydrolase n=1 Tax=Kitasatospora griseola TaxID=2064 RepID=UPI0037FBE722